MFYVLLQKRLGTLDLEKCVQFGVKPGPLLGQLKSGQDVVLPDGTLVHSKDVKTPDDPGPVFIGMSFYDNLKKKHKLITSPFFEFGSRGVFYSNILILFCMYSILL